MKNNQNQIKPHEENNHSRYLVEQFVNSLLLETQSGSMLKWYFEEGKGSAAYCICEGYKLLLIPELLSSDRDRFSLFRVDTETNESCLLMNEYSYLSHPSQLRDLYQAVTESIDEYAHEPLAAYMRSFLQKSNERQCLYVLLDAAEMSCSMMRNLLQNQE